MKSVYKISALALAVIVMCLSFSGCAELNDLKNSQSVWTEDKSIESFIHNGETYIRLEGYGFPDPLYNQTSLCEINVTKSNVPALLSSKLGDTMTVSSDENFICGKIDDATTKWSSTYMPANEVMYCKEDIYDEVSEKLDSGVNYTGYGFDYWAGKTDDERIYYYRYLSDEDNKIIDKVLKSTPQNYNEIPKSLSSLCPLHEISEDKYFGKCDYQVYKNRDNDTYHIAKYSKYYDAFLVYNVPDEYNKDFKRLFVDEFKDFMRWETKYITDEYGEYH